MATFGVKLGLDNKVFNYIEETNKRIKADNFIKSPFNGKISYYFTNLCIINMEPLYPNLSIIGWFMVFASMYFTNSYLTAWSIPGIIVIGFGFFWSKYFFFLMFRLGLRKAGYNQPIRLLKDKEIIMGFLNGTV